MFANGSTAEEGQLLFDPKRGSFTPICLHVHSMTKAIALAGRDSSKGQCEKAGLGSPSQHS
jgi:hypothetical protein